MRGIMRPTFAGKYDDIGHAVYVIYGARRRASNGHNLIQRSCFVLEPTEEVEWTYHLNIPRVNCGAA
jgi:hypothetical protein